MYTRMDGDRQTSHTHMNTVLKSYVHQHGQSLTIFSHAHEHSSTVLCTPTRTEFDNLLQLDLGIVGQSCVNRHWQLDRLPNTEMGGWSIFRYVTIIFLHTETKSAGQDSTHIDGHSLIILMDIFDSLHRHSLIIIIDASWQSSLTQFDNRHEHSWTIINRHNLSIFINTN